MIDIADFPAHIQRNSRITETGCWEWTRSTHQGYAATTVNAKRYLVHRYAYMRAFGDIPTGLVIDHLCRNRACFNPEHLDAVTIPTNISRGIRASQTHCKRGHAFDEENTFYWRETSEHGFSRKCRACRRQRNAEAAAAQGRKLRRSKYTVKDLLDE